MRSIECERLIESPIPSLKIGDSSHRVIHTSLQNLKCHCIHTTLFSFLHVQEKEKILTITYVYLIIGRISDKLEILYSVRLTRYSRCLWNVLDRS